jgi:hypothetical protein
MDLTIARGMPEVPSSPQVVILILNSDVEDSSRGFISPDYTASPAVQLGFSFICYIIF